MTSTGGAVTSTQRYELFETVEREIAAILSRARGALQERARLVHPDLTSSAYLCLMVLREHPAGCPQSALVERLSLDKGVVSRAVSDLQRLGFVERTRDDQDGRAYLLHLTDLAAVRLVEVTEARRATFRARFEEWDDVEVAEFASALQRYNAVFRTGVAPRCEGAAT